MALHTPAPRALAHGRRLVLRARDDVQQLQGGVELVRPGLRRAGRRRGDGCKRMRFIKPCTGTRGGDDDDDVSESPPPPPPTVGAGVVDPVYRCLRTSSTVEGAGYHQHLSRCVSACAKSAGMEWLNLLRQNFDFCWAVRSLRRIGWYKGCYHCVACADRLHLLAHSLGVVAYMGGWQCTAVPSCNVNLILHDSHKNMTLPPRELHALRP